MHEPMRRSRSSTAMLFDQPDSPQEFKRQTKRKQYLMYGKMWTQNNVNSEGSPFDIKGSKNHSTESTINKHSYCTVDLLYRTALKPLKANQLLHFLTKQLQYTVQIKGGRSMNISFLGLNLRRRVKTFKLLEIINIFQKINKKLLWCIASTLVVYSYNFFLAFTLISTAMVAHAHHKTEFTWPQVM